jgi:hypothetical protein
MYRGSTTEGSGELVEPRHLWELGPKAAGHEGHCCHRREAATSPWTCIDIFVKP